MPDPADPLRQLAAGRSIAHGAQLARSAAKLPDKEAFRFRDRSLSAGWPRRA
jgi:hypothetical protein